MEKVLGMDYIVGTTGYEDVEKHFHDAAYQASLIYLGEQGYAWSDDDILSFDDTTSPIVQTTVLSLLDEEGAVKYHLEVVTDRSQQTASLTLSEI